MRFTKLFLLIMVVALPLKTIAMNDYLRSMGDAISAYVQNCGAKDYVYAGTIATTALVGTYLWRKNCSLQETIKKKEQILDENKSAISLLELKDSLREKKDGIAVLRSKLSQEISLLEAKLEPEENLDNLCLYLKKSHRNDTYQVACRYYLVELKLIDLYEKELLAESSRLEGFRVEVRKQLESLVNEKALKLGQEVLQDIDSLTPFLEIIKEQLSFVRLLILQDHKEDFAKEIELLEKIDNPEAFKKDLIERIKYLNFESKPYTGYVKRLKYWVDSLERWSNVKKEYDFQKDTLKDAQEYSQIFNKLIEHISSGSEYILEVQTITIEKQARTIKQQTQQMRKMGTQITGLQGQCDGLAHKVNQLNSTINQLNGKISRLQSSQPYRTGQSYRINYF